MGRLFTWFVVCLGALFGSATISGGSGGDAAAYVRQGEAHYKAKDYDRAIDAYSNAIRTDPDYFPAYFARANCWFDKGDFKQAIRDYTESIRRLPNPKLKAGSLAARGRCWIQLKEVDKAFADFESALQHDPESTYAYMSRAELWSSKGEWDKSIADWNQTIKCAEKPIGYYYSGRGLAWANKEEWDRAISDYSRSIQLDPNNSAYTFANRGYAWRSKNDFDRALRDYDAAIKLLPKDPVLYIYRGSFHLYQGSFEKAAADYARGAELDRTFYSTNSLAWFYATCPDPRFRDGRKAVSLAEKAIRLSNGQDANSMDTLAAAYAECREFDKAVEHQTKAWRLTGEDQRDDFRSRLELYQKGMPYRQPVFDAELGAPPKAAKSVKMLPPFPY
jgi:tetratricopeptide (TPR) repeat protein